MSDQLEPCHFCGGSVFMEFSSSPIENWGFNCENPDCDMLATLIAGKREDAIKTWNTRAPVRTALTDAPEGYEPKRLAGVDGVCRALELQEGERHCGEGCECQTLTPSTWLHKEN